MTSSSNKPTPWVRVLGFLFGQDFLRWVRECGRGSPHYADCLHCPSRAHIEGVFDESSGEWVERWPDAWASGCPYCPRWRRFWKQVLALAVIAVSVYLLSIG